jgi:2-hydroxy-3-keto-5-methylthiopentenyl-1-phosphate phosphatase
MKQKTAVQIDFDGTVTLEDVSFLLLDTYVGKGWRKHLDAYSTGDITVGTFNQKVFGMMKAGRKTMTDFVLSSPQVKVRPGFKELISYCREKGYKPVIVSNGLEFYIRELLKTLDIKRLEVHAAENKFFKDGMEVRYLGPDGQEVDAGFKETYTEYFKNQGYSVIYIGNGTSDIYPARLAQKVFATEDLLKACKKEKLEHYAFDDFYAIIDILKSIRRQYDDKRFS